MSKFRNVFSIYLTVALIALGAVSHAAAQTNRNGGEVRDILQNLLSAVDDFRYSVDNEARRNTIVASERDRLDNDVQDLEAAITLFDGRFQRGRESKKDVSDIIEASENIENFVSNKNNQRLERAWEGVQDLVDRLASVYKLNNVSNPNTTNNPNTYPTNTRSNLNSGLTGTYQLDAARSENSRDILDRVNIENETDRADLESKLEAADQIALDVRGNQVILASSKASPVSFTADGTTRSEQDSKGRTVRVRALLSGQTLTVSSIGGETDYTVTFASLDNGRSLKVTRRITTPYLNQTVFAESFYTKSDAVAGLGIDPNDNNGDYSSSDSNDYPNNNTNVPTVNYPKNGTYVVPNGTIITGTLDHDVTTKVSQNNDRFRMTVTAPNQYKGAVIEGYLSGIQRSGKVSGRSQITFNFERIRLANGQTYDFAGFLQSITDTNGKTIKVGTEGEAKGDSQTKETAKRGGIGAGIGAIIGAIAGGGKGAAIGAIIGGGAGAGSVIVTGKEELELKQGSTITVQASAPNK
jgi:hypothetical protein